jgi:hypothetical protein
MATLWNTISNIFTRQAAPEKTTTTETRDQSSASDLNRFRADLDRKGVVETCRKMYKVDPRVEKMHRQLARDMVRGGFVLKTSNAQAKQVIDDLQVRLGLNQKCEDYVRLTARDGDSFVELGINEVMQVAEITRKPTLQMRRNSNSVDKFENPARAFYLLDASQYSEDTTKATWFSEWQIIHLRWNHDEESRYGQPMMSSGTSAYRRVSEGEMDVSVRRKTRSGIRYQHVIEGSPADVEAYKVTNKKAIESPFSAVADYFTNKKSSINVIQGEGTSLDTIGDIKFHLETLATASDVPLGLIGYGADLNRDILGDQKEQYGESLEQGREWLTDQLLKPLFERAWLLAGILPQSVQYSLIWRPRVSLTPALIRDLADALLKLKLLQVSDEDISAIMAYFLPGIELNAATMAAAGSGDSERLAGMLKGLSI